MSIIYREVKTSDAEELLKGTLDEILEEKFQELLGGNKKEDSAEDTGEEDKE